MTTERHNYLLFSDVHLGGDMVQHARPWTVARLREVLRVDGDLSSMLDHYRAEADPGRPWRLVIAGDLVDLVGMSIAPGKGSVMNTPLTPEEHIHGLGTSRDHAALKMQAVVGRHGLVFDKLAAFVAAGHSVVLVRGNHDMEFYWDAAQAAFVQALVERSGLEGSQREAFEARIEFRHWFYYVENLLYVEHGHQYDTLCAYQNWLAPRCPVDPSRLSYSFSDILLRYVVRPTRGMSVECHENQSIVGYIRMGLSLGVLGCVRLLVRFWRAIAQMFRTWFAHMSARAAEIRAEHERRLGELSERWSVSAERLRALSDHGAAPVTGRALSIMRGVFLDGLIAMGGAALLLVALAWWQLAPLPALPGIGLLLGFLIYLWMQRAHVADASHALRRAARNVARVMPTRFVVMGHTHEPVVERMDCGATYINLGGWAVDDLDGRSDVRAPNTHLVIRHVDGDHRAELLRWDPVSGPSPVLAHGPPEAPVAQPPLRPSKAA